MPNIIRIYVTTAYVLPLYINKQQYESIHGLNENISIRALPMGVDFYKKDNKGKLVQSAFGIFEIFIYGRRSKFADLLEKG